jgi:hypothetical protein
MAFKTDLTKADKAFLDKLLADKKKAPVLDFDKPFSEQTAEAKASLERLARKLPRNR